jgi:L-amino acid N-acyltransferase YncA
VSTVAIAPLEPDHWAAVRAILEEGIATGQATFEAAAPHWVAWDAAHRVDCRLIALDDGAVVGWAALAPVSLRAAYRGVAEVSVYVAAASRGRGVGRALLEHLVADSEHAGLWTLQAVVFPENAASIALHLGAGFRLVGRRERIARLGARWRDTLLLERRSPVVARDAAEAT